MAVYKNSVPFGSIVTDGLVLNLDATNTNSYPGSGTTWTDTSFYRNSGSLVNGPTFLQERGRGSIVFDGVDDHTAFPGGTFNYSPGILGSISLEMWVYPTGPFTNYASEPPTTNLGGFIGQGYFGNSIGWGIGVLSSSAFTPTRQFSFQVRNFATASSLFGGFELNNWYHVVGSFNRNDFSRLYINGSLTASTSSAILNGLTITPSLNNAAIARGGTAFFSGCRISVARIYNKALSAQEVQQNYNALKSRFGL